MPKVIAKFLFQEYFEISAFCKYIRVISIKTTSPNEGNLRAERIRNSGTLCTDFFGMPC